MKQTVVIFQLPLATNIPQDYKIYYNIPQIQRGFPVDIVRNTNLLSLTTRSCKLLIMIWKRLLSVLNGSPENAGLENGGPKKSRGWKMQDWKMTDENARLENARLENDGRKCRAGK